MDHRLLIPVYNDLIDIKDFNKKSDSIFDLKEEKTVYFKIAGKGYSIPGEDCVFLPLPYSSAEELSKFFADITNYNFCHSSHLFLFCQLLIVLHYASFFNYKCKA